MGVLKQRTKDKGAGWLALALVGSWVVVWWIFLAATEGVVLYL